MAGPCAEQYSTWHIYAHYENGNVDCLFVEYRSDLADGRIRAILAAAHTGDFPNLRKVTMVRRKHRVEWEDQEQTAFPVNKTQESAVAHG